MEEKIINVLHIDTERTWRGGQQQAVYLHEGLLQNGYKSHFVCQPGSALSKYMEVNNLTYFTLKMFGEIDINAAIRIAKYCKENKINIVHAHSAHSLSIAILTKLFYRRVKLIEARRVDFSIRKNIFSRMKYNSNLIDRHVSISENIKTVLIKDGVPEDKISLIRSGVDLSKFRNNISSKNLREELKINKNDFVIGTVASFAGHKDYPNFINAARIISNIKPQVKFVAVGEGKLRKKMEEIVQADKLNDKFFFAGHRTDLADFYNIFNLFVLSSKKEGLGTSVIDALAFGLPVVATSAGGIKEIIVNNVNGILVEPGNPEALAKAIIEIMDNEQKRKVLVETAMRMIDEFSIEKTIRKNIALYHELLNG